MQPEIEKVIDMIRDNKVKIQKRFWKDHDFLQVWECVAPHLKTLGDLEDLDPDALRLIIVG